MIVDSKVKNVCLRADEITAAAANIADQLERHTADLRRLVLVGVSSQGEALARRIANRLEALQGFAPPRGRLEFARGREDEGAPSSYLRLNAIDLPVPVEDCDVVVVVGVLGGGQSAAAACALLQGLAKRGTVRVAALIDREVEGCARPADFVGRTIAVSDEDEVVLYLEELDGFSEAFVRDAK